LSYSGFWRRWFGGTSGICGTAEPLIVRVRERGPSDPPSDYWGWESAEDLARGARVTIALIHPRPLMFEAQFPYGVAAEERAGKGRRVNLLVEEVCLAAEYAAHGEAALGRPGPADSSCGTG
jgi:hypothetical protein